MSLQLVNLAVDLDGREFLAPFSASAGAGEVLVLMGPSGSGKSTLLSAIAGTLQPPFGVRGDILIGGKSVTALPPEQRRIGRLFQDDLLFPHMTVLENLLFGTPKGPRASRVAKAEAALQAAGLGGLGPRAPHTLSGGQRQRAALMRSLLAEPAAMLLDEPFSKLDLPLRAGIRALTFSMLAHWKTPALLVTHDIADAPAGARVLQIAHGRIEDV
jgi:putative thiamine transport system ATP-binding protein